MRWALLEGAGFLALIAFFTEGHVLALGIGLLMIVAIAFFFPTKARYQEWMERRGGTWT